MSKSLCNFVSLENQIHWESTPRLMTLSKYKERMGNNPQKWELAEIQNLVCTFCDETIRENSETITEDEFSRLMKYAKNKKISYKDCYQYSCTNKINEGKNIGANRTTGIRIRNLQVSDIVNSKYYNYTANVVAYDIKQDGSILSKQQLSFFFRLTQSTHFPEICWKEWSYEDAYNDVVYDEQCINYMAPRLR